MTDLVTVNRDRSALLPDKSPEKGYRITREEAHELGLLDSPEKPIQKRRSAFDASKAIVPGTPQKRRTPKKG